MTSHSEPDDFSMPPLDDEPLDDVTRPRRSTGGWLVGLGSGAWLLVATLRCTGTPLAVAVPAAMFPNAVLVPTATPLDDATPAERVAPLESRMNLGMGDIAMATVRGFRSEDDDRPLLAMEGTKALPLGYDERLLPETIHYTVKEGGSLKDIANLFKLHHHEIRELNPGIDPDDELPPLAKVVVYRRDPKDRSESIGLPSAGSIHGGVPVLRGPGRLLKMTPWKGWGTASTVTLLDHVLREWARRSPGVQPILVGNLSSRTGGHLPPHATHQSGRDVDLGYPQKLSASAELIWRSMDADNLDRGETWALLKLLDDTKAVEVIYMDRAIQKLLYDHARSRLSMSTRELARWFEYPRPTGSGSPLIRHVRGHTDHLHVRFSCQPHESRCRSKEP